MDDSTHRNVRLSSYKYGTISLEMKDLDLKHKLPEAMLFALSVHSGDIRKDGKTPYMSHLLGVTETVARFGGTSDEIVAALLHDTLEDHPESVTPELLAEKFGETVRDIVLLCTDTPKGFTGGQKPDWILRKREHLSKIAETPRGTPGLIVLAADKLHNTQALASDLKVMSPNQVWSKMKGGLSGTTWYVASAVYALGGKVPTALVAEIQTALYAAIHPNDFKTLINAETIRQMAAGHPYVDTLSSTSITYIH